jgi:hypothetical protein
VEKKLYTYGSSYGSKKDLGMHSVKPAKFAKKHKVKWTEESALDQFSKVYVELFGHPKGKSD